MQFRVGQKVESTFPYTCGEVGVVVAIKEYGCYVKGFSDGTEVGNNIYSYSFEYLKPLKIINLQLI